MPLIPLKNTFIKTVENHSEEIHTENEWCAIFREEGTNDGYRFIWEKVLRFCNLIPGEDRYTEVTLEFLVDELNNCAGEDMYGADWHYEVKDGKPYSVEETYIIEGLKE